MVSLLHVTTSIRGNINDHSMQADTYFKSVDGSRSECSDSDFQYEDPDGE